MILVLHGDDLNASYSRLQDLLAKFPKHQKVTLSDKNGKEDLINAAFTKDIFETDKVIICENFISTQKIKIDHVKKFPNDTPVIFWEHKQLTPAVVSKFKQYAQAEIFKEKPQIFWFLDAISPSKKNTFMAYGKLENPDELNLIFHLENRMFFLIIAKLQISQESATKITGKPIAPWQWERYQNQSKQFNLDTLKKIYSGTLKIDSMIKRGETNLSPETLISILLAKYLQG